MLDLLKYIIKPSGQFFPGFTFDAILAGVLYGCMFYQKPFTLRRVLAAKFIVVLICNVFFNTLWISMLYGKAFMVLLPARVLKNLIMWPIDSVLLFSIGRYMERIGAFKVLKKSSW